MTAELVPKAAEIMIEEECDCVWYTDFLLLVGGLVGLPRDTLGASGMRMVAPIAIRTSPPPRSGLHSRFWQIFLPDSGSLRRRLKRIF